MKSKLLIIFDEDSKVLGFEKAYVFSNERDAESFFRENDLFVDFKMYPDEGFFTFKLVPWSGTGKCFWCVDKC